MRDKHILIRVAWTILRTLVVMLILTLVFRWLLALPSEGSAPYTLMVYAGMLPWYLCSNVLSDMTHSKVSATYVNGKSFSQITVPSSGVLPPLGDFAVNLIVLSGLMCWYGHFPGWRIMLLPLLVIFAVLTSFAQVSLTIALNVMYREYRLAVLFALNSALFVAPIGFSSTVVSETWRPLYSMNPIVGVIDAFRWCLLGIDSRLYTPGIFISMSVSAFLLYFGMAHLRRTQRNSSDAT